MTASFFILVFTALGIVLLTFKARNVSYPVNLKKSDLQVLDWQYCP